MQRSLLRRRWMMAATVFVATLTFSQVASAAPVPVDDIVLVGAGAEWDVTHAYDYGTSGAPCMSPNGGYTIEDGVFGTMSDAFDGGLYLEVGGEVFDDVDGQGVQVGQQLRVGPTTMGDLVVTRTDAALSGTPTLRTLIRLANPTGRDVSEAITWDSALGADDDEATRASSAWPNRETTSDDNWVVASDNRTSPSDPPVTFAVYGPGSIDVRQRSVPWAPEDPDPVSSSNEGCVVFRFRATVPAGQTRYLLFFTELHGTNERAVGSAARFDRPRLSASLLEGISPKVAKRVMNWDLG